MLQIEHLSAGFNNAHPILTNISFSIAEGEIVGLMGRSGSGKSTLLRCLAGLHPLQQGQVLLDGKPLLGPSEKLIPGHADIRLVHQQLKLPPNLTAEAILHYQLRYYEDSWQQQRAQELLNIAGIAEAAGRKPAQLSGGQQQRLAFVAGLADMPRLLLLDEPFSQLDVQTHHQLRQLLTALLAESNTACLLVSHYPDDLLQLPQRLLALAAGALVQQGSPQQLYEQPVSAEVAGLLGPINQLPNGGWFRPEQLKLVAEGTAGAKAAKVLSCRYSGSKYVVQLEVEGQQWLTFSLTKVKVAQMVYCVL
jgi:iron(III) transport system ATP-binding protein